MARVFTEGFEAGDLLGISNDSGGMCYASASGKPTPRSGTYAWGVVSAYQTITAVSEAYVRFAWWSDGVGGSVDYLEWRTGTTVVGKWRVNAVTKLCELYSGSTLVATGSIPIQTDTWYLLEFHIKEADSPNGVLEMKVDGITDATYTGDTKPSTGTTFDNIRWERHGQDTCVDDIAINDTSGGADNSWCGDGHVIALVPNGDGDNIDLTPSAGSNYQNVDERPADGDTTYNESASADDYDLYALAACGLTSPTILRVWAEARAKDTVAAGGVCQLGLKTESTEYWSGNISLLTTYTTQLRGTIHTVNPNTSAAWTTTQLDALQAGFKVK